MGLFSGGGILGSIGGVLGINTSRQQQAIGEASAVQQAGAQAGIRTISDRAARGISGLEPFQAGGLQGLQGLQQGSTIGGFGQNISDIFQGGALDPLIAERQRAANAAFGQAGLTRSGGAIQAAADIPTDLAFQLEALLSGRQGELAGLGFNAASSIANIQQGAGTNIAALEAGQGVTQGAGLLGGAQARSAGQGNLLGLAAGGLAGLGGDEGVFGGIKKIGSGIAGLFSDVRLKTNLNPVGEFHDLTVYEWDWISGMPEEMTNLNIGFIAQDVLDKYPEFSGEECGFLTINYEGLLEHLEQKWSH